MPAPNGPQFSGEEHWTQKWLGNIQKAESTMERDDPRNLRIGRSWDNDVRQWANSSFMAPAPFPTKHLQRMDSHFADLQHEEHWDPNPKVRRFQKPMENRPKDLTNMEVNTARPEFIHEAIKGTGAPEHVTVYHFGDVPKDARYASGSVDPNWPEHVRSGWRSKDPSVNRGRLHIHLVPHEQIIEAGKGAESEVFFRRGTPFNKTPRSSRQQKRTESFMEDRLVHGYEQPRENGRFSNQ